MKKVTVYNMIQVCNKDTYEMLFYKEAMNITLDLPFRNIHNPFTNERISIYLDKQSRMSLGTLDYFVKLFSHSSKGVVIVASA